jgi:hypothetical protein
MEVLLLKPSVGSRHGSVRRRRSKSSEHAQTLRREREAEVLFLLQHFRAELLLEVLPHSPRHRHDANSKDIGVYLPERRAICNPDVFFISRVRDKVSRKRVGDDALVSLPLVRVMDR